MDKISLQMYTMREHTKDIAGLENTLAKLSKIGFHTLQYTIPESFDTKEVKRLFDSFGIQNDSVFVKCLDIEDKTKKVISDCELFGTKYIRINSIPSGISSSASGFRMFAHYLNEVTSDFKKHGLKLLYHFHAFEFIRFGDKRGIDVFLEESDPEVIQIIPDTHWIQSGGADIIGFLKRYRDRYDYVHVKDFAIGARPQKLEERPILFAPVGEGNIDWKSVLDFCEEKGVLSYAIEQDNCYGRCEFDCVRSSFDYLRKMGIK